MKKVLLVIVLGAFALTLNSCGSPQDRMKSVYDRMTLLSEHYNKRLQESKSARETAAILNEFIAQNKAIRAELQTITNGMKPGEYATIQSNLSASLDKQQNAVLMLFGSIMSRISGYFNDPQALMEIQGAVSNLTQLR